MILLLSWLAAAVAATPGGYRVGTARPVDAAGARTAVIVNPSNEIIAQATPRFSAVWGKYGLDAEVSGLLHTGTGGTVFGGLGSLRSGHWYVMEGESGAHHRFGAEIAFPIAGDTVRPDAWGSVTQETVMPALFQAGWAMAWDEDAPWELRAMAGAGLYPYAKSGFLPLVELAVVKVIPMSETVSLVLEQEVLNDASPATFRPLVRFDIGKSALDSGFQIPWGSWILPNQGLSSIQFVAQYRGMF